MEDRYTISTRLRGGYGKSQKYAWSVYGPDGEEIANGEETGEVGHAVAAANKARQEHFMMSRRK